ncbi:MAG: general secretion pathway protein GspB [Mariprofundus sp.]|nr:general secretion pathway protein GspB [Mariprofundus sp.]
MSYILDALKKSDEKRGSESAALARPAAVPLGQSGQRRFVWPLMLAVAALIAGWMVAQWQASGSKPVLNQSVSDQSVSNRAVASQAVALQPAVSQSVASGSVVHPVAEPTLNQPQASRPVSLIKEHLNPAQESKPIFKTVNASSLVSRMNDSHRFVAEQQPESVNIKSRFELPEAEQQSLPELSIEGHMYDVEPQTRMVIINGKVRKEKQSISAGLVLQEITVDGVILNYHGHVFHMGVFER